MTITVKFFASLREQMGCAEKTLDIKQPQTVSQVWQQVSSEERPAHILMAINMDYVNADAMVKDGDEVAFFPPVTGG